MNRIALHPTVLFVLLLSFISACKERERAEAERRTAPPGARAPAEELSQEQLEKGIGPVDHVELGPIDPQLAAQGEQIFSSLCASCHKLDERYVGPPLRDVTERRTPEFIMNMILNPSEMIRRHPEVKQLLAQYYIEMPNQNLTEEEARAVLEYLRLVSTERAPGGP